eukprot:5876282-Prymnesium_polylepis.1
MGGDLEAAGAVAGGGRRALELGAAQHQSLPRAEQLWCGRLLQDQLNVSCRMRAGARRPRAMPNAGRTVIWSYAACVCVCVRERASTCALPLHLSVLLLHVGS